MRVDRRCSVVATLMCLILGVASVAAAQSPDQAPVPAEPIPLESSDGTEPQVIVLSAAQSQELERWLREFEEWQKWASQWLNRRQPGMWAYAQERNKKPDPPVWLESICDLPADDQQIVRACKQLASWRDDPITAATRQAAAAAVAQREAPTKSIWWRHVHVDALWSTTQSNMAAFGLFGAHLTMEVQGRLQVFVAPGIMLVSVPGFQGNRELAPATDWGVTYRLFDVGRSTVHFNLVHAWMLHRVSPLNPQMTLVGLSASFKPRPR
jgi:hypothetical protein